MLHDWRQFSTKEHLFVKEAGLWECPSFPLDSPQSCRTVSHRVHTCLLYLFPVALQESRTTKCSLELILACCCPAWETFDSLSRCTEHAPVTPTPAKPTGSPPKKNLALGMQKVYKRCHKYWFIATLRAQTALQFLSYNTTPQVGEIIVIHIFKGWRLTHIYATK